MDQPTLDRISEEFAAAIRDGETHSIEDYLKRYGDDDQLRTLLASVEMIEQVKRDNLVSQSPSDREARTFTQLDDYQIVREIGRGGMGLVFEAFDQSLHRRVAIKVLPSGLLSDPRYLDRFEREAKAAAGLRHPNIVSVLGVGQSDQYHYYVMDYIDGVNLRQWLAQISKTQISKTQISGNRGDPYHTLIDDTLDQSDAFCSDQSAPVVPQLLDQAHLPRPSDAAEYYRWVARVGQVIADALHYAHSQGTLHRDIKPANLLLDQQGIVSITDFGLAKVAQQQPVTRTGDVLGTPQYMAPESFDGSYDVRSETYAVGLTLYELLTHQPAISGNTPAALIRQAVAGVALAPRKLDSQIPRDLETIVLKSISVDPQARYQTAAQLKDDLECFLDDMPISARRVGPAERVWRWSRRQPVAATLTLTTFASLLALAVVSGIAYWQTKSALQQVEQSKTAVVSALAQRTGALADAEIQRQRAEANLSVAIAAFDQIRQRIWQRGMMPDAEILGEVAETSSGDVSPADAQILESLLGFFDQLAANNSSDLRSQSAAAARRAGDIYQRLGRLDDAMDRYSDALQRYQSLAEESPQDVNLMVEQARVRCEQIVTASLAGQVQRASMIFDQTVDLFERWPLALESPDGRYEYARAHALFASIMVRAGMDAPIRRFRSAGRNPPRPGRNVMAMRSAQERNAIDEAIDVFGELADQYPDQTQYQVALARAYRDQSKVAARATRPIDAEQAIKRSIEGFERLLSAEQDSDSIRYELAKTLSSSEALGLNQAIRLLRADELSEDLLDASPSLPRYQALRAHVLQSLAKHQVRIGGRANAQKHLSAAMALYDALIERSPELPAYRVHKAQVLDSLSDLMLRQGDRPAAIEYLRTAINELKAGGQFSSLARNGLARLRQKLSRLVDEQ